MDDTARPDELNVSLVAPPLVLRCKVCLLGDSTVGKTSIAQVFKNGSSGFPKNYNMTVGLDFLVRQVPIEDTTAVVEMYMVDCGGFSVSQDLLRPHWENANAFMLVYDVTNPDSLDNLASWYEQIQMSRPESAITGVVVASKMDLVDFPGCVSADEGKKFAAEKGLEFFDVCASRGNVEQPFALLALHYYNKYRERLAELETLA
uniref:Intraflagellar transport protein 27 n=1 Tax=Noctiluca scintillans TaxID=2966 RepID=A0A7S0ZUE0_NOCSC